MFVWAGTVAAYLALAATVVCYFYEYRRTDDLVTPLHLALGFFGFFFLLSYFYTAAYGSDSQIHPFNATATTATTALIHLILAFTFLTAGYYSPLPHSLGERTINRLPESELPPGAGRALGLTLFLLGLLSTWAFVAKNGGVAALLAAENIFVFRTATGTLRYWLGLQIGIFGGLALYLSAARDTSYHFPSYLLGAGTIGIFFMMHTRMRVVFGVLLLVLYAWYADSRITQWRLLALAAAFFVALGLFRPVEILLQGHPLRLAVGYIQSYLNEEPLGLVAYPDYFQGYMALVEGVPSRVPLQWGRTFLAVPWVPFELFEELRAYATDPTELTEIAVYGYDRPDTGVIASGFGVLYLNFHLPGVVAGATVFGFLYRWAYTVWQQAGDRVMVGAMYFVTIYYFFVMMAKTPLVYNVFLILGTLTTIWTVVATVPHPPLREAWEDSPPQRWLKRAQRLLGAVSHVSVGDVVNRVRRK